MKLPDPYEKTREKLRTLNDTIITKCSLVDEDSLVGKTIRGIGKNITNGGRDRYLFIVFDDDSFYTECPNHWNINDYWVLLCMQKAGLITTKEFDEYVSYIGYMEHMGEAEKISARLNGDSSIREAVKDQVDWN